MTTITPAIIYIIIIIMIRVVVIMMIIYILLFIFRGAFLGNATHVSSNLTAWTIHLCALEDFDTEQQFTVIPFGQ